MTRTLCVVILLGGFLAGLDGWMGWLFGRTYGFWGIPPSLVISICAGSGVVSLARMLTGEWW